ncbi:MAG: C45 family peptidase [Pseudomonadota bacterium]
MQALETRSAPRRNRLRCLAGLLATGLLTCSSPAPFKEHSAAGGRLRQVDEVWILELEGTPAERGKAEGEVLGEQIRWLIPKFAEKLFGADGLSDSQRRTVELLKASIPPDHLVQLKAMAKAASVDETSLVALNLALEIFSPMLCSCLAVNAKASQGGTMKIGRNLDWFGGEMLQHHALIVVERGPGIQTFAHVTWPGLVGAVTGINDHKVFAADLAVIGMRADATAGTPVMFGVRQILEHATSADAARLHITEMKRTVPQNYLFADPGQAFVLETKPAGVRPRELADGWVGVANLQNEDQKAHPDSRYKKMQTRAQTGALGSQQLKELLLDVSMGELTVQSVVMDLSSGELSFATAKRPAAKGPWHKVDTTTLLATP